MTLGDFEMLRSPEVQYWLETHLKEDPAVLALGAPDTPFPLPPVLTQLKFLQKSREKLPSFFARRCLLPPRAFEQASSERAAAMKSYKGSRGLDLTCGLGVDSLFLSRKFEQWTALEADADLARVSRYNFERLGAPRIEVINTTAETFLKTYGGPPFDLIYADPDRRDSQGRRLVRLEDCQPDILQLLPLIKKHSRQLLLKLSPLFDLAEAERVFAGSLTSLGVVSVDDECKEVLVLVTLDSEQEETVKEVWLDRRGKLFHLKFQPSQTQSFSPFTRESPSYVLLPDVALYKARLAADYFQQYHPELTGGMNHPEGFFFSQTAPAGPFPGKTFRVKAVLPFKPKALRKQFSKQPMHVVRRHFPLTVKEIRKATGIPEGGEGYLICTQLGQQKVALHCVQEDPSAA